MRHRENDRLGLRLRLNSGLSLPLARVNMPRLSNTHPCTSHQPYHFNLIRPLRQCGELSMPLGTVFFIYSYIDTGSVSQSPLLPYLYTHGIWTISIVHQFPSLMRGSHIQRPLCNLPYCLLSTNVGILAKEEDAGDLLPHAESI